MGPPAGRKNSNPPRNTGDSPDAKRQKSSRGENQPSATMSEVKGNDDSVSAARSITFDDERPPRWFTQFETKIYELLNTRLQEQDEKIESVRFDLDHVNTKIAQLEANNRELADKLDDLENRSRRNNLILHGVPEAETDFENCTKVVTDLLVNFVGLDEAQVKASIQRVHRTPTNRRAAADDKPRIIHVAATTFQDKLMIRKSCIQKFKNETYKGNKLFVSDDLSKGIQMRRKAKIEVFKRLQREGKHPFYVFPDLIKYRNGQDLITVA